MSDTGVVLFPNIDFLLKGDTHFHAMQTIEVLPVHGEDQLGLHLLCMRRALKFYLMSTKGFRDGDEIQLFLTYGRVTKEIPILKQCISKWLVETFKCSYAAHDLEALHQTWKLAVSIAEMQRWLASGSVTTGVDTQLICQALSRASSSTFAKYYRLNLVTKAWSDFGMRVAWIFQQSSRNWLPGLVTHT